MAITLSRLKSKLYLDIDNDTYDSEIQELIDSISAQAISCMANEDITSETDFTEEIERKLCIQINYEFRRRHDAGLSSVTFPNGNINKYETNEWLPDVKKVLLRHKPLSI
jgi:hypothetical protein